MCTRLPRNGANFGSWIVDNFMGMGVNSYSPAQVQDIMRALRGIFRCSAQVELDWVGRVLLAASNKDNKWLSDAVDSLEPWA